MKRRSCFVSNSSSSSFCIFGYEGFYDELSEAIDRRKGKDTPGYDEKDGCVDIDVFAEKTGLLYLVSENDEAYLGLDIYDMKGNETMDEFKKRATEKILEYVDLEEKDLGLMVFSIYS